MEEKTKYLWQNIKSKYILKQIFDIQQTIKSLNIIRYSKAIQISLDINLNTYKRVFKVINQTEIIIIPKKTFFCSKSKKFININEPNNEFYCHIYFNNDNKEITRYEYTEEEEEKISSIKIILDYNFNSFHKLFERCV